MAAGIVPAPKPNSFSRSPNNYDRSRIVGLSKINTHEIFACLLETRRKVTRIARKHRSKPLQLKRKKSRGFGVDEGQVVFLRESNRAEDSHFLFQKFPADPQAIGGAHLVPILRGAMRSVMEKSSSSVRSRQGDHAAVSGRQHWSRGGDRKDDKADAGSI